MTKRDVPRLCDWCGKYAGGTILIQIIEQCSGPGWSRYACARCRTTYHLKSYRPVVYRHAR
ncbi:hypothetical protein ACIQNU_02185 [Streptomyces sp. NPDC091292]|uniref:hypothetical protein n=1 Tax=Streptomyces sp. NPDC091292 TaxID=3365991 RepID=UPI00380701A8